MLKGMKYVKRSGYLQIMEIRHSLVALLIIAVGLTVVLLTIPDQYASDDAQYTWLFFISALVLLAFVLTRQLVLRSDKFSAGIKAEQKVRKALSRLDDSYTVFHNFPIHRRGDIDFVVVGPTGVFAVEVKRRKMPQSLEMDKFAYQARKQVEALNRFIRQHTEEKIDARPVVVIVDLRYTAILVDRGGVLFTTPEDLVQFIQSRIVREYIDRPKFISQLKKA
jgi:hypothetical protein